MEYMALEKPVVSYDLVETRYSGGEFVLYTDPNRVEDLSNKILMLTENEDLRIEMGKKGRSRV